MSQEIYTNRISRLHYVVREGIVYVYGTMYDAFKETDDHIISSFKPDDLLDSDYFKKVKTYSLELKEKFK